MSDDFIILDEKGNRVQVGSIVNTSAELELEQMTLAERIRISERWDEVSKRRARADEYRRPADGIVTDISDFDGDVDDDTLRSITIFPRVTVRWQDPDDVTETFSTTSTTPIGGCYYDQPIDLEVNDLVVLNPEGESA